MRILKIFLEAFVTIAMGGYDIDPTLLSKMKVFIRKECVARFCALEGGWHSLTFSYANGCQASYFKFENVEQGCERVVGVG
jgi:hypothetical protein